MCIRDIEVGDQITCDYDLIIWDCPAEGMDACACGSASCRGRVWGFKHLSPEYKKKLVEFAFENVLTEAKLAGDIDEEKFQQVMEKRAKEKAEDFK